MPLNRNALMRMYTIDACLRRRQRLWTIEDLQQACQDALYEYEGIDEISTRTIRRDLQLMRSDKLGYNAPIIVKDRKYYTYERADYSITQLPLSKSDLAELSSALDIIRHYGTFKDMSGQEDIITRLQDRIETQEAREQVVYIETNSKLRGLAFLGELYTYIIKRRPIEVDYQSFTASRRATYHLSPYILKEYNNRWFLLGYSAYRDTVMTLALDRIVEIRRDRRNAYVENTFFEPHAYFDQMIGVTRRIEDRPERVVLTVDGETAPYVTTKPLHHTQRIEQQHADGGITIAIDVIINPELERLILGYGRHIQVLSPAILRQNIAAHVQQAAAAYQE